MTLKGFFTYLLLIRDITANVISSLRLEELDATSTQCDFRFDLFFSFSFVLVLQYSFVLALVLPVKSHCQHLSVWDDRRPHSAV